MVQTVVPSASRLAVAAALMLALGVAGCGRKGGLDPPPAAAGVAVAPLPEEEAARTAEGEAPAQAAPRTGPRGPAPKRFILDWLID